MSDLIERARMYRAKIEENATVMDDESAADFPALFPSWSAEGITYLPGDRVRYEGVLYKVLQEHTSQDGWNPAAAPSLFAEVLPGQGGTDIGEWTQPDSTNPYMTGDRVIYNGKVYESTIDNNVWSPEAYPSGWKEVEQ